MRWQVSSFIIFFLGLSVFHIAAADDFRQKQQDLIRAIHRCTYSSADLKEAQQALDAFGIDISHASIALFAAVRSCREDMVMLMLLPGIEVDVAQNEKREDTGKYTALMQAAEWGLEAAAQMLLDAGADKTICYCNQTADEIAEDNWHPDTAALIRDHARKNMKSAAKR